MNFLNFLNNKLKNNEIVLFDGGFGTEVLKRGIDLSDKCPESLNITDPDIIYDIHKSYVDAGSDLITTNTFGANRHKLQNYGQKNKLNEYIKSGIDIARKVALDEFKTTNRKIFVAATIGPIGSLVEPIGSLTFDDTYSIYKEVIQSFDSAKPDIIVLETMLDLQEARIALLAAKDTTDIPIIVSMTYEQGKRTTTGTPPEVAASVFDRMGAIAIAANCSVGPAQMLDVVENIRKVTDLPILIQSNAGMPVIQDGKTIFPLPAEEYSEKVLELIKKGANIIGGCCGTTPEHIKKVKEKLKKVLSSSMHSIGDPSLELNPGFPEHSSKNDKKVSYLASRTKLLEIDQYPIMIGERINPNALKKVAESLKTNNFSFILQEAQSQVEAGANVLDINVSAVNTNEPKNMKKLVSDISGIVDVPLCIDSPDYLAIEEGLKSFAGKALVNSVNGEQDRLAKILPLIKKYGASVIALTMDDNGIPDTVEGRIKIAERIIKECDRYGIPRADIYVDTLVLTISTNPKGAKITLDTIREIKARFGVRSTLGLSNISFGLPGRQIVNSNFLAMAIEAGLDAAITNPKNELLCNTFYSSALLCGYDTGAKQYIDSFYETDKTVVTSAQSSDLDLKTTIIKGMKELAIEKVKEEIAKSNKKALDIINEMIIPALDVVGDKFEKGEYFLPQLLLSADTAKEVSKYLQENLESDEKKEKIFDKVIVFATVKGDLHDIGKNIVISVLENYGYKVIDLGKSIDANVIIDTAIKNNAKAICLSALMTTTMQEMEAIVNKLQSKGIRDKFKILIGGAVVNQEYADKIGADAYSKDAMETVAILRKLGI